MFFGANQVRGGGNRISMMASGCSCPIKSAPVAMEYVFHGFWWQLAKQGQKVH
jgi:hypothetical protein